MAFDTIHETALSDITSIIKKGINTVDSTFSSSTKSIAKAGSLTQATKGLILEFPVLISKANHIGSAGIVAKAYESKFVTLLQLALSASNITNSKDALSYLKNFHTNLDSNKMSVDDFIATMDNIVQHNSANITADSYAKYKAITEDMRNLCYYFEDDVNESSLNDYKVMNNYGKLKAVKEADNYYDYYFKKRKDDRDQAREDREQQKNIRDTEDHYRKLKYDAARDKREEEKMKRDAERDVRDAERQANRDARDAERDAREIEKNQRDKFKDDRSFLMNNLVSSDVKKANELTPTMMVINFVVNMDDGSQVYQSTVIGVKAKLYEVEPTDVINKIITKNIDSHILLKLVRVSTREISFVKDFLLAIDDAKLDALSKSRKGSSNKLFKVLERRALGGKIRKMLKMNDYSKAISSLVISQEEAEELLKNNIDVSNPGVIRPIMEKLNLISFAIIDESSESVKFIFDTGDDVYETIPLSKLEKEEKDGMSRKVINLMAKMNR